MLFSQLMQLRVYALTSYSVSIYGILQNFFSKMHNQILAFLWETLQFRAILCNFFNSAESFTEGVGSKPMLFSQLMQLRDYALTFNTVSVYGILQKF